MRGIVRLLLMFGPMIFRQYQKYQRNRERDQMRQALPRNNRQDEYQRRSSQNEDVRYKRRASTPPPPSPSKKKEKKISQEEQDFLLREEDFMIDKEIIEEYAPEKKTVMGDEVIQKPNVETPMENIDPNLDLNKPTPEKTILGGDDDLNLKDIFFDNK